ncbi:hypothetical protein D3C72_1230590 [compost metagenome]
MLGRRAIGKSMSVFQRPRAFTIVWFCTRCSSSFSTKNGTPLESSPIWPKNRPLTSSAPSMAVTMRFTPSASRCETAMAVASAIGPAGGTRLVSRNKIGLPAVLRSK